MGNQKSTSSNEGVGDKKNEKKKQDKVVVVEDGGNDSSEYPPKISEEEKIKGNVFQMAGQGYVIYIVSLKYVD